MPSLPAVSGSIFSSSPAGAACAHARVQDTGDSQRGGRGPRRERQDLPGRRPRVRGRHEQAPRIREGRHRPHRLHPDEIERKYSINLALAVAEWMDAKVNLIDTPGYLDFTGEALAGVYAADGAVVVVSATGGVEVGTEKVWDYCEGRGIPRLFFVSLMDKEHAGFERVYEQIKRQLTPKVIPVEIPVGEGPDFHGIINLFSKKCHLYKKGD